MANYLQHSRREFLKKAGYAVGTTTLFSLLSGCIKTQPQYSNRVYSSDKPNILFLMSDDHACKALSCYGSNLNSTPNLDRLAKEGMLFNNAFCTNSLCAPSRAVILTGKYSHKNGLKINPNPLLQDEPGFNGKQQTFPKLLKSAGYQTAILGKWHLKSEPTGFDYWNILVGQGTYNDPTFIDMGTQIKKKGYVTDIITDEAINWLEHNDKNKPFFLMCNFKSPHAPHLPKNKGLYNENLPEPTTLNDDYKGRNSAAQKLGEYYSLEAINVGDLPQRPSEGLKGINLRKRNYQEFYKGYLQVVAEMDDNIGRLFTCLEKNNIMDNTIIVYTSDNGFHLGEHGWYNKMWMTEPSLRIPLLVRYPKEIVAGTKNNDFVSNLDFASTFLDYSGYSIPDDMQGKSFRPILKGIQKAEFRKSFYYHYYGQYGIPPLYGIRTNRYKLIYYYTLDEWELFDLQQDPDELVNIYRRPQSQAMVSKLKKELKKIRTYYDDTEYDFKS